MAFIQPPRQQIILPVADKIAGILKQQARFVSLFHHQNDQGECSAKIVVLVTLHQADGTPLAGEQFPARIMELKAENDTLVAAATGQVLAIRQGENDAAWQARITELSQGVDTMLQGDYFEYLRENEPVRIGDLIRYHIQQADALGRFQ